MKTRSRLEILIHIIHRLLELPRMNRLTFAMDVVEQVDRLGLADMLAAEGISFVRSGNVHHDARVNAQKLFRWLGQYEGQHPIVDRLFYVEQAVVSALPIELRLQYLNDVFGIVGVTVVEDGRSDGRAITAAEMAVALTKENSEAQCAVISLGVAPTRQQVLSAYQELKESSATTQASMRLLELEYSYLNNKPMTDQALKSV
ncbi:hypothetical protein [Shewanella sp. Isolate11]|uniref:hypothetical protein n=1 Tax=Shewanella sp. Isolate11 TaxID=2908530 RepID=UPI001EFDC920|nr:hypothetical protein [Shewanella sp. Isolate11]MCG9697448.1 hypothetical protein [Shewanella sp. Isolate11]